MGDAWLAEQRLASREASRWPVDIAVVVLGNRGRPREQDHPGLLRRGEDLDVRRQPLGLVQRADAHEIHPWAGAEVVAQHSDATGGQAPDLLSAAAARRRVEHLRTAGESNP